MCNKAKTSWHKNSKRILLLTHQVKDLGFSDENYDQIFEFPDEIHYRTVQTFEIERKFPDEIHYQTVRTLKLSESFQTKNMTRLLKWNESTWTKN
ncbi:hypothetical protein GLOIN_2v1836687 [Rhizophagus irregularis DAOM 181602=DAOM 197198]|nr:hypothetical protein GLOIN_2v1836687 [Rhizophagus irregularis DAOM 181602=DAOM 197198]